MISQRIYEYLVVVTKEYTNAICLSMYSTYVRISVYFILLGITQHPANVTLCQGSNAILSCAIFNNGAVNAADTTSWFRDGNISVRVPDNMISNTRDGDVVTSVLTIENVSLNDNGNGYFCAPAFGIGSDIGVISVAGKYLSLHVNVCVCIEP